MGPQTMSAAAACIVGDRAHLPDVMTACWKLGGGWIEGGQLWEASPAMDYVVLLAHEPRRIARRAPLVILVRDGAALQAAVREACEKLDDVTCAWIRLLDPEAQRLVDKVLLADATPQGRA